MRIKLSVSQIESLAARQADTAIQQARNEEYSNRRLAVEKNKQMVERIAALATKRLTTEGPRPAGGFMLDNYQDMRCGLVRMTRRDNRKDSGWGLLTGAKTGEIALQVGFIQLHHEWWRFRPYWRLSRLVKSELVYTQAFICARDTEGITSAPELLLTAIQEPPMVILNSTKNGVGKVVTPNTPAWQDVNEVVEQLEAADFSNRASMMASFHNTIYE